MRQIRRKRFNIIEKNCRVCEKWKPLSQYYKDVTTPDKYSYVCKTCEKTEKDKYRQKHRLLCSTRVKKHKLAKYNLTLQDYDQVRKKQKNKCAICGGVNGRERRLCIDHNHKTNQLRGLLCDKCNVGLGCFNDDLFLLNKALQYLQKSTK